MNGSPTKRPRDLSPSPQRSSKRHRPDGSGQPEGPPSIIRKVGRYLMSWLNPPPSPAKASRSRRRRSHRIARSHQSGNGGVIELIDDSDDDHDTATRAAAEAKRRDKQNAARSKLNDHVPPSFTVPYVDESRVQAAHNVHPYMEEPLFKTSFASSPFSPSSGASSTASPTFTAPRHPDTTDRPIRRYAWERSDSSGSSQSNRSSRSAKHLSPAKRSPSNKNLRNAADRAQLDMLEQCMRGLERRGSNDGLAAFERIKAELESERSPAKTKLHRARSMGHLRSSRGLGAFTTDLRKTLDEASVPRRPTYDLIRPHQKRPIPPVWERLDSPLHRQQQIEKAVTERKIQLALARAAPPIPSKLTPSQDDIADDTLRDPAFQVTVGAEQINATSIRRLRPGQWLNDEVVNCYAQLINARTAKGDPSDRVHCWSSYFYHKLSTDGYVGANLKRWTKRFKLDIFSLHKMLIPINHSNTHWVCAVVDFRRQRIEYYDSMHDSGSRMRVFQNLRDYLQAEHKEKKGAALDLSGWTDAYNPATPKQENVNDCGVFACQTLEAAGRGRDLINSKFEFKQSNMPFFRRLMIVEIASCELAQRPWALPAEP